MGWLQKFIGIIEIIRSMELPDKVSKLNQMKQNKAFQNFQSTSRL